MKPLPHLAAGAGLGCLAFAVTRDPARAAAAAGASAALDLDHLLDFLLFSHRPYSWEDALRHGAAAGWRRVVFCLHSYELLAALAAAAWSLGSPMLWWAAAGMTTHLVMDEIGNRRVGLPHRRIHAPFYFFLYRLSRGFRVEAMSYPCGAGRSR